MTTQTALTIFMSLLDRFPDLDQQDRAQIFHAWDAAPENPIDKTDLHAWTMYCNHAGRQWELARKIPLHVSLHRTYGGLEGAYALTLDEVAGGASDPTKDEIMRTLARAAEQAKEYMK